MKKALALSLFVLLCSVGAEAQSCLTCYDPPSGELYCDQTTFNGWANCRPIINQNGCEMWGACSGISGDECGSRPHCIPQKWTSGGGLPETAPWVVASVRIDGPEAAAVAVRKKS